MILPHFLSLTILLSSVVSELATSLSQPLISPTPPASACYPSSSPAGNCSDVSAHYRDGNWRSDQPWSMENTNFEAFVFPNGTVEACYLNVTLGVPCGQGSIPPIGVDARTAEDVQAAVIFSKENNLRLVVKNTGHDYLGRSAGRGGFLLWTHHLKTMSYDDAFTPEGSTTSESFQAATLGAGIQWREAYEYVNQQGRVIVGGISEGGSVGSAGGWVMGGGHSAFAPKFGLGVDNVLQFTIVLANGTYVTTNSFQHPDLFWALRGGGGGTFGVVTSATYKTHPTFPLVMSILTANFTSPEIAQEVVTEFVGMHPKLSDAGWGGYSWFTRSNIQLFYVGPNISAADAKSTFGPFVSSVSNAAGAENLQVFLLPFPSFADWLSGSPTSETGGQVGNIVEIASRLLPRDIAVNDPAKAARIMLSIEGGVAMNSIAGGAVSRVDPSSTGLNPSWRKTVAQAYTTVGWPEGSSGADIQQARERLKKDTEILDRITEDSGSYLNEGSLYEKDFKKSYFGSHYKKLKSIKNKYDPTSLFVVASGVGSDDWDKDLQCRL